jgi:type II secretory pathway pseudopilin PulG
MDNPLLRLLNPTPMQNQRGSGAMPVMQQPQMPAPQMQQKPNGMNFMRDLVAGALLSYGGAGVAPVLAGQQNRRRQQEEMFQQQQEQTAKNQTIAYFEQKDPEIANALKAGVIDGRTAMAMWQEKAQSAQPGPGDFLNAGGGRIYDARNRQWVAPPEPQQQVAASTFDPEMQGPPMAPAAQTAGRQPPPAKPAPALTEGQSKDTVYSIKGEGALPVLSQHGKALTDFSQSVAGNIPMIGNYMKSPEYQQAEQAGAEFLAAILRKDTGAAVTQQEFDIYGAMYLPRPGDSPQVLQQKEVARIRALEAIRAGLPTQAILKMQEADQSIGSRASQIPQQPVVIDGFTIEAVE